MDRKRSRDASMREAPLGVGAGNEQIDGIIITHAFYPLAKEKMQRRNAKSVSVRL